MGKTRVRISLATKFRLLIGLAVVGVIAAALVVPWYFMELLAVQSLERPAAELARLRINEHLRNPTHNVMEDSELAALHTAGEPGSGRKGPFFIRLGPDMTPSRPLDAPGRRALRAFRRNPGQDLAISKAQDEQDHTVYRCFRAVRVEPTCMPCHGPTEPVGLQFQPGQLVGLIDVTMPAQTAAGPLVWWTRGAFLVGAVLASLLAFVAFAIITQRLVLRPMRHLRDLTDKVAEGDLAVRSTIQTGDELQRLGESFNEMLDAIADQHNKLRSANRALDLKLSELSESNVALYQANTVKSEFLANISHELRTPLNSIIGFADLLSEAPDDRIRRYGGNISTAAKALLSMINDLLDLAKIEAGKVDVRMDKVSISDICQTLAALTQPLADKKQLRLTTDLAATLPLVTTDASKVQQILYNLLSNAVKFTPAGGDVMLSARIEEIARHGFAQPHVCVSVTDTGPGIPEADQKRIFEKFYQGESTLTKEAPGTGLGLSISRELAGLLGGELSLQSTPGHGTTFTLILPVEPARPGEPPAPAQR